MEKTVLIIAGNVQQYEDYIRRRRFALQMDRPDQYRLGSWAVLGDTRYVFVNSPEKLQGYDRETPVVLTGDYSRDVARSARERYVQVEHDPKYL